jgi:photosystem II stability/assembly factor-like uncharacterized protein
MAEPVVQIGNTSLWYRAANIPGPLALFEVENTAMGDLAIAGLPTIAAQFVQNAEGVFYKLFENPEPPGDLSSVDLTYRVQLNRRHPLYNLLVNQQAEIIIQRLFYSCPPVNNRVRWKRLEHYRVRATGGTKAATRDLASSQGSMDNTISVSVLEDIEVYRGSLSRITISEAESILCIAGLSQNNPCLAGYPGRDRILVIGAAANAAPANALYSVNGGGSFAAFGTDATPFGVNSNLTAVVMGFISETEFRVIWTRAGDAGTKAQIAYQDFSIAAQTLTAASWTAVTIAASANADDGEALFWPQDLGRLYIAAEGDIYVNEDNGETDPGAKQYTGSNAFAQFARRNDDIWVVGASNTILVERSSLRDTFAARTGPSGGGAFTAITFAADGKLFAGNGTSLMVSTDEAGSTAAWRTLKDFGSARVVKSIFCKNGSSELLRVTVDNTTPGAGEIWETEDGGQTWRQISASGNDGYNAVYQPADIDQQITVGDDVGSLGYVELLS